MSKEQYQEQLKITEKGPMTIEETLSRGVEVVLPDKEGLIAEMSRRKIRLYLGIDPTSPELHIGHTVPLRKLRQFQDLGHDVYLLFGTFTGKIGDPSDKSAARIRLTDEQIAENMSTYVDQAGKILDMSKIRLVQNHEWLGKLTLEEIIDIQANFTVQQMLERSMFKKRIEEGKPIWLQEFSYPWMQGWDAVALDVDLEVGGKDQLFNMLVGQTLVRRYRGHEKWVVGTKLIEDPSGKKMGKTEGNIVSIQDWPEIKYEGFMSWPDTAVVTGFELITSVPMASVYQAEILVNKGELHPMDFKEAFAWRAVAELDGLEAADYARDEFDRVMRRGETPRRIKEIVVEQNSKLSDILVASGLVKNSGEALRKIASGAVYLDNTQISKDFYWTSGEGILKIGKKTIKNIRKIA